MKTAFYLAIVMALTGSTSLVSQTTYVDDNANGGNNGTSWADAYQDLQTALAATSSGEIWVAEGRYRPAPAGQPTVSFMLKNQVALYGGFQGNETSLYQRDPELYHTYLDGDLAGDDTYGSTWNWWQYNWTGMAENCGRIVDGSGVQASAILDGFQIVAGYGANAPAFELGGGLFIESGSPTIRNCTFRYNSLGHGAAVYVDGGNPTFENCVIKDGYNFSRTAAGVWVDDATVTFTDCVFQNHYTVTNFGGNDGSAYYGGFGADVTFLRCDFIDNQIGNWFAQGDSSGSYGAGIFNFGDLVVDSCSFSGGFGNGGSAITVYGGMVVRNSRFFDNFARPYPINSLIDDGDVGAAICVFGNVPSGRTRSVDSSTFVDNYCDKGAGIYVSGNDALPVTNCILYYNDGPTALPGEDQTPRVKRQFTGNVDIRNCCVEELWVKIENEDPVESPSHPQCIDEAPKFVNWSAGDLHLTASSPCLNTGATHLLPPGLNTDKDGNARVYGTEVDMGCYEPAIAATPSLAATSFVTEVPTTVSVFNAQPGEMVHLVYSLNGLGAGPNVPQLGGLQLGILAPVTLFQSLPANASGHAVLTFNVPASTPLVDVFLQGAIARGAGGSFSVLSNTDSQTIYLKP
ncbi:MAG: right-handed parallel beta-helix repeat-containing protein [Planctomycetes bacterium]|nr:right-handed parallel beta-helix repeat-containing protein [Planctomycetota bacterium]